jgi:expansin (peptidoglycan-binding protein)
VKVVDDCDECEANQINLQATPFSKLANMDLGRIKIEYREVRACKTACVLTVVYLIQCRTTAATLGSLMTTACSS